MAVSDRAGLKAFIDLPFRLHQRDLLWVPPLRRDVEILLSRTKNPFFEHGEAEYFLAERGGEVVGRIAAIANRLHNEAHHDRVGFFGFFETIDEHTVAKAYGVWKEKSLYGKKYLGIERSAFLIDEKGKVVQAWYKISPKDTPSKLLEALGS